MLASFLIYNNERITLSAGITCITYITSAKWEVTNWSNKCGGEDNINNILYINIIYIIIYIIS